MKNATAVWVLAGISTFLGTLLAAQQRVAEPNCSSEAPKPVQQALERSPNLTPSCRTNPWFIEGDFDGDSKPDFAVLVLNTQTHARGFLLVFGKGNSVVVGAGHPVEYGAKRSSDLNFDHWELYGQNRPVEAGVGERRPLKLRGDALLVAYHETASGLFYWDGRTIRWYQQGD